MAQVQDFRPGKDGSKFSVKVGDRVGFKSDYEQVGEITAIKGDWLTLKSSSDRGFGGEYIGGNETTEQHASDCWVE